MIGIVVVAHGKLADCLIEVTEHVVGPQEKIKGVNIGPEDDTNLARERIVAAIRDVRGTEGVVVLTDMFGGTPSNLAIAVMKQEEAEVIAGVNLPMMIKLASVRSKVPLAEAVTQAQDAARKYINVASAFLTPKT